MYFGGSSSVREFFLFFGVKRGTTLRCTSIQATYHTYVSAPC